MNIKARRKRLLVLADFLENEVAKRLDGAKFDVGEWGLARGPLLPERLDQTSECGFVGCAAGWSYYCPPLVKAGIRATFDVGGDWLTPREFDLAEFFGITVAADYDEFAQCFIPADRQARYGKRAIAAVVKKLRKVAATEPRP